MLRFRMSTVPILYRNVASWRIEGEAARLTPTRAIGPPQSHPWCPLMGVHERHIRHGILMGSFNKNSGDWVIWATGYKGGKTSYPRVKLPKMGRLSPSGLSRLPAPGRPGMRLITVPRLTWLHLLLGYRSRPYTNNMILRCHGRAGWTNKF